MDDLDGRTVAVEGLGKVGFALCSLLSEAGARIVAYDIDAQKISKANQNFGAIGVAAGQIHAVSADVYSPCALGAVLDAHTIPQIKAKVVAGAANNQLSDHWQGITLKNYDVTYCPDYIVNAGGVLSVAETGTTFTRAAALERVEKIYATTKSVLETARKLNVPTGEAADILALSRLRKSA